MPEVLLRLLYFIFLLLVLPKISIAAVVPNEGQDVWRVDLHHVARLYDSEQHFSKLKYYRWQENRWQTSDAETFFRTQEPDIPLIVFAPGYNSPTVQTTQLGFNLLRNFDPNRHCRVLFWNWYSTKETCGIRGDIRGKLPIVNNAADYLALLLQKLAPKSKVSLFGFSFGSRIVCAAAGTLQKNAQTPEGLRLRLVLSGAATDQHWFAQGQKFERLPEIAEKILVTYNPEDWALRFYPFMYGVRSRAEALGYKGLPMRNIASEFRDRFENVNVNRYLGSEHKTLLHIQTPAFRSRIPAYFFFE